MEFHQLNSVLTADGIYADFCHTTVPIDAAAHQRDDAHIHDYCELYFNLRGDVSFSVENTLYPVQSGDLIITMPHEVHYCIYNSDGIHEHYCLWLWAAEQFRPFLSPFLDRKRGEGNRLCLDTPAKEALMGWLDTLLEERDAGGAATVKSGAAVLNVLNMLNEVKHCTAPPLHLPPLLGEILSFIEQHLDRPCPIQRLCDTFFVSRSSLGRLFRRHLGTTPTKYIENKRLALAKRLLEENASVQAVCEACGFADYSHFIALFKSRFGVTPLQYKKARR